MTDYTNQNGNEDADEAVFRDGDMTYTGETVSMDETGESVVSEEEPAEVSAEDGDNEDADEESGEPGEEAGAEETETGADTVKQPAKPYYKRYYMLYGKETPPQDLDGTRAFLESIGINGGELKQAREGNGLAEAVKARENQQDFNMYCAYCGSEILGVDFYRMPDGRKRCTTCSRTIVDTKEELYNIYSRVLRNLETFFDANLTGIPIDIETMEERMLKRKLRRPLSDVDNNSMLILGVAVNKKDQYSIYLENASPRITLIATFAHEMTHIWQYTNWGHNKSLPKISKFNRLVLYEGMAKWVEIQYLYLVGETAVARREEAYTLDRKDEYGIGFRVFCDRFPLSRDAMVCIESPFTLNSYPVDIEKAKV